MASPKSHLSSRVLAFLALLLCLSLPASASANAPRAHGQLLHLIGGGSGAVTALNTAQSNNWFGYNQGALEPGEGLFHSITGNWVVPRASQHLKGKAEYSSDWIGIGGGCENSSCAVMDSTLIQTGTEQDVAQNGKTHYSAWWEVIPSPSLTIKMKVRPGDHMHAALTEVMPASNLWKIVLKDLTRHESYSKTTAYSSTQGTAEWIEETPLLLGSNAGFASLPKLTSPHFDHTTANGHPTKLKTPEQIELTNSGGKVIGVPSAPDPDHDGFNACAWAKTCKAPGRS